MQKTKLSELFKKAGVDLKEKPADVGLTGVTDNSRTIEPGNLFVATRGVKTDSHVFISDAVEKGAVAIVVERDIPAYPGIQILKVDDSRDVLGRLVQAWHNNPTRDMLVFGVSGTNGKTTTTFLLESILDACGLTPGVIGTIEHRYGGEKVKASNTTPTAVQLAELLAAMRDAGVKSLAMEVSSHAVDQRRIAGIKYNVGVLTNITQDHLDYHGTMEAYAAAKKEFYFDFLMEGKDAKRPLGSAFNVDDDWAGKFYTEYTGPKIGFSVEKKSDLQATEIAMTPQGTTFTLRYDGGELDVTTSLLGMFNIYNVTGAIAAALLAGLPHDMILQGIAQLKTVPGRFEYVSAGQDFFVIVDYAHTPDALERVLDNARLMTTGKIITVFGCGGDRDPGKRPIMGEVAAKMSNEVVLTNDNPRTETPDVIAEMVYEGIARSGINPQNAHVVLDRKEAIRTAISLANPGDLVLIAGKGHEDYQILGQNVVHFDDRETAREFLEQRMACS